MKILLIRPPFAVEKFYFPRPINESLGLESLEAYLSPHHEIKTIDSIAEGWNKYWQLPEYPEIIFQGLQPEQLLKKINAFQPEIIGITWLFSTQNASVALIAGSIKKHFPDLPIIAGGPYPSADPIHILQNNTAIDMVVYGEGEITLKEILDKKMTQLETIKGLAFRNKGTTAVNPPRPLIAELDQLPIPSRQPAFHQNYSKIFLYQSVYERLKKLGLPEQIHRTLSSRISSLPLLSTIFYRLHNARNPAFLPTADIATSRGCPNHCTFCAIHNIWGHSWRMRSAENVLAEIDMLVKTFKVRHINFQDDNFNVLKERIIAICRGIIDNKYPLTILAPSGAFVPTLDEEVLTWLKKAGLSSIRLSIESGNQDILSRVIKKNIKLSKVKQIVDACHKLHIYTEGAFIFGIPGETIQTMQDSLNFARQTGFDRIIKFIFQPYPQTELYDLCVAKGYLTDDYDPQKTYVTGNHCYVKTESFSPEDVLRIVNR